MLEAILSFLPRAIAQGIPLLYGSTGEIITQKSGNMNLGIPGVMYVGGICGVIGAFLYEQSLPSPDAMNPVLAVLIPTLFCLIGSLLMGLLFCFLTVTLRANQNVTGLTLTIFGGGVANFFGGALNTLAGGVGQISVATTSGAYRATIPGTDSMGWFGRIFLNHGFMVYLAIVLAVALYYFLTHTRTGLNLRAVGENPATADAAGIRVTAYKYMASCVGAGISGLGGLFYTMDYIKGTWASEGTIEALGWLAVALVIFATWRPLTAIWGSYLFGFLSWLYMYVPKIREMLISGLGLSEDSLQLLKLNRSTQELFKMLPYVVTILVLIVVSMRKKRENQLPASLGIPYFREER